MICVVLLQPRVVIPHGTLPTHLTGKRQQLKICRAMHSHLGDLLMTLNALRQVSAIRDPAGGDRQKVRILMSTLFAHAGLPQWLPSSYVEGE